MRKKSAKAVAGGLDDLMTQTEAAEMRGVTVEAISDLIRRGRLSGVERYGKTLVSRIEVISLEKQKPGPKGPRKVGNKDGR